MNSLDFKLLELLKENSKLPLKDLEKELDIRSSTIHARIKKLESKGIIQRYSLNLDNKQLGYPLVSYIMLTFDQTRTNLNQDEIAAEIAKNPRCEEVHLIAGEYDILVKVRAKDIDDLGNLVTKEFRDIDGIGHSRTFVSLKIIKESTDPPFLISKVAEESEESDDDND